MAEAAQGTAADIERRARESAEVSRREAIDSANGVLQGLKATERELSLLLRSLSQEADTLRAKLDRARLLSGPAVTEVPKLLHGEQAAQLFIEAEATTIEADALDAPAAQERAAAAPEEVSPPGDAVYEPDAPNEPGAESKGEAQGRENGQATPSDGAREAGPLAHEPVADDAAEPPVASERVKASPAEGEVDFEAADMDHVPFPVSSEEGADARTLDEDARAHVSRKTDGELADAYRIARVSTERAFDEDNDDQKAYWSALMRATVHEAASRPDFGQAQGDAPGGRREKKRRAKLLKALSDAREQALERPETDDAG